MADTTNLRGVRRLKCGHEIPWTLTVNAPPHAREVIATELVAFNRLVDTEAAKHKCSEVANG